MSSRDRALMTTRHIVLLCQTITQLVKVLQNLSDIPAEAMSANWHAQSGQKVGLRSGLRGSEHKK